ncbi:MAG: helix-turn-helix domain-containing protein [Ferruginibacter sp.]
MSLGKKPYKQLPDKDLLTSGEIILFFRISYRTLMRWIEKKILVPIKEGGILYFKRADIIKKLGGEE